MHKIFVKIVPRFINKINNYQLYPLQRLHSEKEKFTPTLTPQKKSAKAQTKNTTKVCTWVFKKKKKNSKIVRHSQASEARTELNSLKWA